MTNKTRKPDSKSKISWPLFSDLSNASQANWIWLPDQDKPASDPAKTRRSKQSSQSSTVNQTVCFARDFEWSSVHPANKPVWLHVAADSNYAVWLNGQLIDCGQFGNFPTDRTYDSLDVTAYLHVGTNKLRFLVHYHGETNFSYLRGEPGLLYLLQDNRQAIAASSPETSCRLSTAYHQGPIYWTTGQLGFSFAYDALADDDWLNQPASDWHPQAAQNGPCKETVSGGWSQAVITNPQHEHYRTDIRPRPLPKLILEPPAPARLIAQGTLLRRQPADWQNRLIQPTPAEAMQSDFLSAWTRLNFLAPGSWSQTGCDTDLPPDPTTWPEGLTVRPEIVTRQIVLPTEPSELEAGQAANPTAGQAANRETDSPGLYLILDLGREEVGFLDLDIEAGPGTIIDLAHGEHLADQRVRATVGGRHFANRIVCREGRTRFSHVLRRLGGRYLELHLFPTSPQVVLHCSTLRPSPYPLQNRGAFACSDSLHNRIHEVSRRTLHLCMHEHYEDCPWREQALYAMDSRNQALCGYYCFGEYDFPAISFALLGASLQPDGFLELIAPSTFTRTIPSFSLAWIIEVWEHFLHSGRVDDLRRQLPVVRQILEKRLATLMDGLLPTPTAGNCWNFYEWADGLSGDNDAWLHAHPDTVRFDAPLNLFFLLALRAAARIASSLSVPDLETAWSTVADDLADQIHARFWHADLGCYQTYLWPETANTQETKQLADTVQLPESVDSPVHTAELTQALALYAGICPSAQADSLRQLLADGRPGLVEVTLSHSIYKYEALLADPKTYAVLVFDRIARDWGHMLMHDATSFWETIKGSCDFNQAGSLCHGWSAIPVYLYQAYVLGVKPLEPGFAKTQIHPLTAIFPQFSGIVPTPLGPIDVRWDAADAASPLQIEVPSGLTLEVDTSDSMHKPIIHKRK